ncbi:cohesin domain-containing protein [Ectobacillus sp. JY-23]|uniref:cohesin domain-containing protein n=1 Tax=Ectobacillus sp. JY-23 TaxID=2933872 RepID=UPI001FF1E91E|nr:cohesin domain-containing protein [Ectobacillus sp. JY-23]UOY91709.1 cohesin domain-containing protein [Ectobacillus sp. JY-23]
MSIFKRVRNSEFLKKKSTRIVGIILMVLLILSSIFIYFNNKNVFRELFAPSITLVSPAPIKPSNRNEITVDVMVSDLPDNIYPAASLSINFDKNKLDFIGVKQGTMMTLGDSTAQKKVYNIPIWKSDPAVSNKSGQINTMYLDMTGGKYAYTKEGFNKKEKNILLRLTFKLRDSVVSGEVYDLIIRDAIIATADNDIKKTSLASNNNTLKTYPAKIVVK